jgi:hypothetical protein
MTTNHKQIVVHIIFAAGFAPGVFIQSTFLIQKNNEGNAVITCNRVDFGNNYSGHKYVVQIQNDEQLNELIDGIRELFSEFILDEEFSTELTDGEFDLAIKKQAGIFSVLQTMYTPVIASEVILKLKEMNGSFLESCC